MVIYTLHDDNLELLFAGGQRKKISYTENSGKVYFRQKFDSKLNLIKHEGIYLGVDELDIHYFLHNDYHTGVAKVVTKGEFAKGQKIKRDKLPNEVSTFLTMKQGLTKAFKLEPLNFPSLPKAKKKDSSSKSVWVGLTVSMLLIAGLAVKEKKK